MQMDFVTEKPWSAAEQSLAAHFGIAFRPANERVLEIVSGEIELSEFGHDDVSAELQSDRERLLDFSRKLFVDCRKRDYGEEWDADEGNQQAGSPPPRPIGVSPGFLVTHTLFFLYAKYKPEELLEFVKRRKIPHARKVAKDVLRVFDSSKGAGERIHRHHVIGSYGGRGGASYSRWEVEPLYGFDDGDRDAILRDIRSKF